MSKYLNNLVARTLRQGPMIEPRVGSLFEPLSFAPGNMVAPENRGDTFASTRRPTDISAPDMSISGDSDSLLRYAKYPSRPDAEVAFATESEASIDRPSFEARTYHPTVTSPVLRNKEADDPTAMPPERPMAVLDKLRVLTSRPLHAQSDPSSPGDEEFGELNSARVGELKGREIDGLTDNQRLVLASIDSNRIQPVIANKEQKAQATIAKIEPRPIAPLRGEIGRSSIFSEAPPTITVTIGRVDVRAVFAPPPPTPRASRNRTPAAMSLGEYLKQRNEGRR